LLEPNLTKSFVTAKLLSLPKFQTNRGLWLGPGIFGYPGGETSHGSGCSQLCRWTRAEATIRDRCLRRLDETGLRILWTLRTNVNFFHLNLAHTLILS